MGRVTEHLKRYGVAYGLATLALIFLVMFIISVSTDKLRKSQHTHQDEPVAPALARTVASPKPPAEPAKPPPCLLEAHMIRNDTHNCPNPALHISSPEPPVPPCQKALVEQRADIFDQKVKLVHARLKSAKHPPTMLDVSDDGSCGNFTREVHEMLMASRFPYNLASNTDYLVVERDPHDLYVTIRNLARVHRARVVTLGDMSLHTIKIPHCTQICAPEAPESKAPCLSLTCVLNRAVPRMRRHLDVLHMRMDARKPYHWGNLHDSTFFTEDPRRPATIVLDLAPGTMAAAHAYLTGTAQYRLVQAFARHQRPISIPLPEQIQKYLEHNTRFPLTAVYEP